MINVKTIYIVFLILVIVMMTLAIILGIILKNRAVKYILAITLAELAVLILTFIFSYTDTVGYSNGYKYDNVLSAVYNRHNDDYNVVFKDGKSERFKTYIGGDSTFVVYNATLIKKSVAGIRTYDKGNILVVNNEKLRNDISKTTRR